METDNKAPMHPHKAARQGFLMVGQALGVGKMASILHIEDGVVAIGLDVNDLSHLQMRGCLLIGNTQNMRMTRSNLSHVGVFGLPMEAV